MLSQLLQDCKDALKEQNIDTMDIDALKQLKDQSRHFLNEGISIDLEEHIGSFIKTNIDYDISANPLGVKQFYRYFHLSAYIHLKRLQQLMINKDVLTKVDKQKLPIQQAIAEHLQKDSAQYKELFECHFIYSLLRKGAYKKEGRWEYLRKNPYDPHFEFIYLTFSNLIKMYNALATLTASIAVHMKKEDKFDLDFMKICIPDELRTDIRFYPYTREEIFPNK
jgi:hypothetical protein